MTQFLCDAVATQPPDAGFAFACLRPRAISSQEHQMWIMHLVENDVPIPDDYIDLLPLTDRVGSISRGDCFGKSFTARRPLDDLIRRENLAAGVAQALADAPHIADRVRQTFPFFP